MEKMLYLQTVPPVEDDAAVRWIRLKMGADVAGHCRVVRGQSKNGRSFCLAGGRGRQQVSFSGEESALLIGCRALELGTKLR